jgi:cytosine/adenosine deaminase-related metal-dependent hydrolase
VVIGAAIHSVRAVPASAIPTVAGWVQRHGAPLHVHVSEQPAENAACRAAHGRSPTQLLADLGALGPRTTAVHATHLDDRDVELLASTGTTVCLCPTTERDLGDGIGPARALVAAGVPLSLGSDGHARIDAYAEARAVELDQRLVSLERGVLPVPALVAALTDVGQRSLGFADAGRLEVGAQADLVAVDLTSVRTAGATPDARGRRRAVRRERVGRHRRDRRRAPGGARRGARARRRRRAARHRDRRRERGGPAPVTSTLYDRIGELVTCDPSVGDGSPLGLLHDAAVAVEDGRIVWVGASADAPAADDRVDVDGRCVLPGFVDSHTHLVFAGRRSAEFAARMAGTPYAAGGIRTTVAATRAATDDELRARLRRLAAEARGRARRRSRSSPATA